MISPPVSPSMSTSSSHHPHTFSSMPPPPSLNRAPSAASGVSAASGRESKASGHLSNGSSRIEETGPNGHHHDSQNTPQPSHQAGPQYTIPGQHPFLPTVTSSPPPQVPSYVPPPQHAMAPDPIHTIMSQQGMTSPTSMTSPVGGWSNGPNGWAGPPGQQGYPAPGQFNRQLPNGHLPGPSSQHNLPPNPLGGYNGRMSMPPLSMNGRPSSRQGESRERRRDRDGREDRDGEEDPITTIFVVGFPDDMLEREFQNIFTFSRGFEAATLKFPSGANRPREPSAALLAELQALAANQNGEFGDQAMTAQLEEALASLQLSTASSSSTTPSAAISMTPSAPTGPVLGGAPYSSQSSRRQTIGFARFRTRQDALAAREQLQGRKIDTLTGATLKAEMAKKNLHTKRTTSGEELVGLLLRSGRLAGLMGAGGTGTGIGSGGVNQSGGSSNLPNGIGSGGPQQPPFQQHPPASAVPTTHQPQSAKEAWDSWPSQQSSQPSSHESREERLGQRSSISNHTYSYPTAQAGLPNGGGPGAGPSASDLSNTSASPPASITSPNARPTDSKALLALAEEADEMEGWSVGGMSLGFDNYTPRRPTQSQAQPIHPGSYTGGGFASGQGMSAGGNGRDIFGSSPPAGSDQMSDAGRSMGMMSSGPNPADQNPPINTLYVGNLPAISPPALPPNFLEESLRSMFQTCPGYKRMSFRQKINGPMCFVEFEDIHFAANCIQNLYGHTLSGLVKGGIRLSYSKNSLGQRGVNHSIGPGGSGFGGMPHTGLPGPGYSQNSAPGSGSFGLQLQGQGHGHGQGQSAPPGPSTAPMAIGHHQNFHQSAPGGPTSLSPNAQPFALPSTSPRSRYFGGGAAPAPASVPVPVPSSKSDPSASFQAFQSASNSASNASSQFSPVGSPIRTPGSFSWVSSGSGMNSNGGYGGFTLGSLDGAASAWGSVGTAQQN